MAANTRQLEAQARAVLEPTLRRLGFEGPAPVYRRLAADQVELIWLWTSVRTGVTVTLGSLPPRKTLSQRSARSDLIAIGAGQLGPGVRRLTLPGHLPVRTPADRRALPARLARLQRALPSQARAFFAARGAELERQARRRQLAEALQGGEPKRLVAALAPLSRREAEDLLAEIRLDASSGEQRAHLWRLAPVLTALRPTFWQPAALLAFEALTRLHGRASAQDRRRAQQVLRWVRPFLSRTRYLAGQIALHALAVARARPAFAVEVYDFVLPSKRLSATETANALWCVLAANNHQPLDRARHRRFARGALARFPDDRFVRFNLACLALELGEPDRALEHLTAAVALGLAPAALEQEALLAPLRAHPTFQRLRAGRVRRRRHGHVEFRG